MKRHGPLRAGLAFFLAAPLTLLPGCGSETVSADASSQAEPSAEALVGGVPWQRTYRNDFVDLTDVVAFQSGIKDNDDEADLRKPTLKSNVTVMPDDAAYDKKALAVYTRRGSYQTSAGARTGFTNGRMQISGQDQAPPVRIRTRLRMTRAIEVKSAVMFWPSGGGWPWEVDFMETFGGNSMTEGPGARQTAGERWHHDQTDANTQANEQIIRDFPLDGTVYHVYDLVILPTKMSLYVDRVLRAETLAGEEKWIPDSAGYFGIGKALTFARDVAARTEDAVFVDFVEVWKPAR